MSYNDKISKCKEYIRFSKAKIVKLSYNRQLLDDVQQSRLVENEIYEEHLEQKKWSIWIAIYASKNREYDYQRELNLLDYDIDISVWQKLNYLVTAESDLQKRLTKQLNQI